MTLLATIQANRKLGFPVNYIYPMLTIKIGETVHSINKFSSKPLRQNLVPSHLQQFLINILSFEGKKFAHARKKPLGLTRLSTFAILID